MHMDMQNVVLTNTRSDGSARLREKSPRLSQSNSKLWPGETGNFVAQITDHTLKCSSGGHSGLSTLYSVVLQATCGRGTGTKSKQFGSSQSNFEHPTNLFTTWTVLRSVRPRAMDPDPDTQNPGIIQI